MDTISKKLSKNSAKSVVENWDNNGVAFVMTILSTLIFCYASMLSEDPISLGLQIFGIVILFLMFIKIPIYYVSERKHFSDKSIASLGLTFCFAILSTLLIVGPENRKLLYYVALSTTFIFALLMVVRMNMKESKLNVRKTFVVSLVLLLIQCIILMIFSDEIGLDVDSRLWLQLIPTTLLLFLCMTRLVLFLVRRRSIEEKIFLATDSK